MKALKIMVLVGTMAVMATFGGIISADVAADEPEDVIQVEEVQEITEEEITEETTQAEATEEEITEEPPQVETDEPQTIEEIIAQQTGLTVDSVKQFDGYNDWSAYEVFADGDIYVVTVKGGTVDVVTQLN